MSRIFISHSGKNEIEALALREWLRGNGWDDVFLDVDPNRGLVAGERWQQALVRAGERCEAVLVLISPAWAASRWCLAEYLYAKGMNKRIFGVVLEDVAVGELPSELTTDTQLCRLRGVGATEQLSFRREGRDAEVTFLSEGLLRLRRGLQAAGLSAIFFPWPPLDDPRRSPYRGLEPLDQRDAAVFFGRDVELARCLETIRGMRASNDERILVVVGGSGSGKSSFLRAGLLPRLERDDRQFLPLDVVRPGTSAINGEQGLAHAIAMTDERLGAGAIEFGLAKARLAGGEQALASLLLRLRQRARERWAGAETGLEPPAVVICVDQAEELFITPSAEATALLNMLASGLRDDLAAERTGVAATIVLFGIRSDHFEALRSAAALDLLKTRVFDALRPLAQTRFREVIIGPAMRASEGGRPLELEPELVDALLADAERGADTMPLLAVTLARLYADFGSGGRLRLANYRAIGSLDGVIAHEVESVLAADPATRTAQLADLRGTFIPWLVAVEPDGGPARRSVKRADLPGRSQALVDALIERRLLLTDVRGGESYVEMAHEALMRQWQPLSLWIEEARTELSLQREAEREAQAWDASGRPASSLWPHERQKIFFEAMARLQFDWRRAKEPLPSFLRPEADRLLDELALPDTPHLHRMAIGDRLAVIGDPRPGVGVDSAGVPALEWCEIPAFTPPPQRRRRGASNEGAPQAIERFCMARYATTRNQYLAFLKTLPSGAMGAYLPDWQGSGNRPADNVSFEAAQAYCRWLSDRLNFEVLLPSAAQRLWATGSATPGHLYPWGSNWVEGCCNTGEAGLGRSTAVGMYPQGASLQQVMDLAGNVWEWTATPAESPDRVLLVGGSWFGACARGCVVPMTAADRAYQGANVGFRVVCTRRA